jgi:hypothetical protein
LGADIRGRVRAIRLIVAARGRARRGEDKKRGYVAERERQRQGAQESLSGKES